jgi:hypothetical protein
MSNEYPQNPPNQPHPPQWGPPPQPPKRKTGRRIGYGCLGIVCLFVIIGIIAAIAGGGSDTKKAGDDNSVKPAATASKSSKPAAEPTPKASSKKPAKPKVTPKPDKPKAKVVTFKVWGTAPAGVLGSLDINYGSDSDSRKGTFKNGKFEATLPLVDDALYYNVNAQLQGSGDIQCSVTVDGKTKKAHASGDYNICSAQLSGGVFGGWN